jgi:hypothetical protein
VVTNSDGAIVSVGQDSIGDQTSTANANSTSSSSTTNNSNKSKSGGSIDEVAAILGGRAQ